MAELTIKLHENLTQKQLAILKSQSDFLLLKGPAGTSKTYLALARGLFALKRKEVERIIILRSTVEVRPIGFLPGDLQEKMAAYAAPYVDLFKQLSPKRGMKAFEGSGEVSLVPTSHLRGVTFDDSFVIIDEYQNMTGRELDTALTRIGENTQLVLCGDAAQSDLPLQDASGHKQPMKIVENMGWFEIHTFSANDIVRSPFVAAYQRYKEHNKIII